MAKGGTTLNATRVEEPEVRRANLQFLQEIAENVLGLVNVGHGTLREYKS